MRVIPKTLQNYGFEIEGDDNSNKRWAVNHHILLTAVFTSRPLQNVLNTWQFITVYFSLFIIGQWAVSKSKESKF